MADLKKAFGGHHRVIIFAFVQLRCIDCSGGRLNCRTVTGFWNARSGSLW